MGFDKIEAVSLTDQFVHKVESMIISGELMPGDQLPPARELSARMGVSRPVISAGLIELGSFALFNEVFHWPYWGAYLTALVLSVLWNFTCNRRYTFRSTEKVTRAMTLVFLYYCAFTPLSTLLEHRLADVQGWNGYLVTGLNMVLNFVTEFLYQRFVVYRKSLDTNKLAHTSP